MSIPWWIGNLDLLRQRTAFEIIMRRIAAITSLMNDEPDPKWALMAKVCGDTTDLLQHVRTGEKETVVALAIEYGVIKRKEAEEWGAA